MATVTLNSAAQASSLTGRHPNQLQKRHVPSKSSPLARYPPISSPTPPPAGNVATVGNATNASARRGPYFPPSRPLRPFPSVAAKSNTKPAKTFELPEAFKSGCFMLNLTQAEFSRQE